MESGKIDKYLKEGVHYKYAGGIYKVLQPDFESRLNLFLNNFNSAYSGQQQGELNYELLPFKRSGAKGFEWKHRQYSWEEFIRTENELRSRRILEVGPWNNWLTHHLTKAGAEVVCLDYFEDENNGLNNRKHYSDPNWISIQADIEQPGFLNPTYDVIIFNHCVQFFTSPLDVIRRFKALLNKEGKIIILGLSFFHNPLKKKKDVESFKQDHFSKFGFDIFFNPTKGYMDKNDEEGFHSEGVKMIPYRKFAVRNLISSFIPSKPFYAYGIYNSKTS
jgi:SAM-dependent methyltransferase